MRNIARFSMVLVLLSHLVTFGFTVPHCEDRDLNLRKVPIGFTCRSNSGAIFERVERNGFAEAWKDEDGFVWSQSFGKNSYQSLNQAQAKQLCKDLDATLPAIDKLLDADKKRFRTVIPGVDLPAYRQWYWSSSVDPYDDGTLPQPPNGRIICNGGAVLRGVVSSDISAGVACDNPERTYYLAVCVSR